MLDYASLNELRNLILLKFDITIVSPSDCHFIASTISKKLNKTISTTTIKRIFGFAAVKYSFSKFTINSLLEFVGHPQVIETRNFPAKNLDDKKDAEEWLRIGTITKTITQSTLKSIIANCTIPFKYTLVRKFALKEFENFYQSNFSFTPMMGQPGCGKSVSLAHIVQHFYLKPKSKYHNDIFLFLNAKDFFTLDDENQNFDTEIKRILKLPEDQNIIRLFNHFHEKTGHKVMIIIDSFYDLFALKKNRPQVFEKIIYWLCQIEESKSIKVIVGMRSHLWLRFYPLIRNSHYLTKKWYKGKYYSEKDISNVPLLNQKEVTAILQQMDPKPTDTLNNFTKSKLNYPFYFGYYYSLTETYNKDKLQTNLMVYEIYWRFILDEIYQSELSTEKLMICKKISQLSDTDLESSGIPKKILFYDFLMLKAAYAELLKKGIIIENKKIETGLFIETVNFVHPLFFDFFLANEISEKLPAQLNDNIIEEIMLSYPKTLAESIVKWIIFKTVRNSDYKFIYLLDDQLRERHQFTFFLVENIKHQLGLNPNDLNILKEITERKTLIRYNIIS